MINFVDVVKKIIKEHNPNWPQSPDHAYRILIIGGSGSGKTNSLFNQIDQQPDIDKNLFITYFWLKNVNMLVQSILMILKLLLNNRMIWMIFTKIVTA